MTKRLICLLLALFMLVGLLPTNAIALEVTEAPTAGGTPVGKVQVVVENTTASPAPGGGYGTWESGAEQWSGERIHKTVGLYADSTMMSCIAEALEGHSVTGVESGYISAIDGLKADGSAGWMGTLNGWFTALGFTAYTHANGQLRDGDVIRLSYTCTGGSDISSLYNSKDKKLAALNVTGGVLNPTSFSGSLFDYELVIGDVESAEIALTASATNRNFLVAAFMQEMSLPDAKALASGSWYTQADLWQPGQKTTVRPGDVITIVVGAPNWPSMSNGEYGCNAETVDPGVYYLRVVKTGTDLNSGFNRFFTGLNGVATVTNSTDYPMQVDATENALVSSNAGVRSSRSGITLTFTQAARLTFSYKASSEARYDYLEVTRISADGTEKVLNSSAKADFSGAQTDYTVYSVEAQAGESIRIAYAKDTSTDKNDDCVWLKDFSVTLPNKVILHANDGTDTTKEQGVFGTANLMSNPFVRANYRFDGWATTADGEVVYADEAEITLSGSDMDLYAVWTRLWTVSFPNMPQGARIVVKQGEMELPVSETENVWLLPDGNYSFTAELFGYLTKENVAFTVSGADLSLQDSLTRAPSYAVSFTGVPEGAVLTVSHEVGGVQTPAANENGTIAYLLIPGTYSYTVKRDGCRTVHGTVTVETAAQNVPVSMVAITPWDGTVATGFAGGNGTQDAPYELESGDELAYLSQLVAAKSDLITSDTWFVLTANIDINHVAFTPIGADSSHSFQAHFDGAGYTISNLSVTTEGSNAALFGRCSGTIENLTVDNATINGGLMYNGALVGYLSGTVKNCVVKNSRVTGAGDYTGGMVGAAGGGLTLCAVHNTVVSGTNHVGGLIGMVGDKVTFSYASHVTVNASGDYAGGVIGSVNKTYKTFENLFARGSVTAKNYAGGIIGGSSASSSYAKSYLKNTYAVVDVTATDGTYGPLAAKNISITNSGSFYCSESSFSGTLEEGGTGKTLEELKSSDILSALGAEFAIYAQDGEFINGGLPYLLKAPGNVKIRPAALTPSTVIWNGKIASWTAVDHATGYAVYLYRAEQLLSSVVTTELTIDFTTLIDLNGSGSYTVTVVALGDGDAYGDSAAASAVTAITVATGNVRFNVSRTDGLAFPENRLPEIRLTMSDGTTVIVLENGVTRALPLGTYTYTVTAKTFEKKTGTFELTQSGIAFDISLAYSAAWDGVTTLEPALVDGVYQISNGYELAWFRDKVNEGTSASYALNAILTDNIDLGGHEWTAIGVVTDTSAKKGYIGTFDGNGKTISNLNPIGSSVESYGRVSINGAGLFGYVYTGGVIKNVTVEGTLAAVKFSGGIVAILANGTVENCISKLTITLHPDCTDGYDIGGIVGSMKDYTSKTAYVVGCRNEGNITIGDAGRYVGGIVGEGGYGIGIVNCENRGAVSGGERTGGICGSASIPVTACYNSGNVTATKADVGGIAGFANREIKNCMNTGNVSGSKSNIGGIVGNLYSSGYGSKLTGCLNTGNVSATDDSIETVGALAGTKAKNDTGKALENCYFLAGTYTKAIGANSSDLDETTLIQLSELHSKRLIGLLGGAFASLDGSDVPVLKWQNPNAKSIVVFSVPEGASVTLAGHSEVEPLVYVLENGDYSYTVTKTDYVTVNGTVTVSDESRLISVDLVPVTYRVVFNVSPAGATIVVTDRNGNPYEPVEGTTFELPKGAYDYTVSKFAYVGVSGTFTVVDQGLTIPSITLTGETVYTVTLSFFDELNAAVTPSNVSITAADGTVVAPEGTGFIYRLPNGSYTCVIQDSRYYRVERVITVQDGVLSLRFDLETNRTWDGTTLTPVTPNADGIYEIGNAAELAWFAAQVNAGEVDYNAKLTANIYINYDGSNNVWTPIGSYSQKYVGTFDGNGKAIYGLNAALFGYNGTESLIKNLTVYGSNSGESNVGGICNASYGSFERCVSYMNVTATRQRVGGIVGILYTGGSVTNCANFGAVSSSFNSEYSNSYDYAKVGGIVGMCYGNVSGCVNAGAVSATGDTYGASSVGGIVGGLEAGATITECYNRGTISAAHIGGGIAGYAMGTGAAITNCYNVGTVAVTVDSLNPFCGAVAGVVKDGATLSNCYFLKGCYTFVHMSTSHTDEGVGYAPTEGSVNAECKESSEMKLSAFALLLSPINRAFNMDSENINDGYPVLKWQGGSEPALSGDERDVAADKAALTVDPSVVTSAMKLALATTGLNGSTITWVSSHPTIIATDGQVTLPTANDVTVTLTATITKGNVTDTKVFTVTVKTKASADQTELNQIVEKLTTRLRADYRCGDVYVTQLLIEKLAAAISAANVTGLRVEDITVVLESAGNVTYGSGELISADGKIAYYYADPSNAINGDAIVRDVTFRLTTASGATVVTNACMVLIAWDQAKVIQAMEEAAGALTFDTIRGENTTADQIRTDLTLPQQLQNSGWALIGWTSSNPNVIGITGGSVLSPFTGTVTPAEQDTVVTLTATFTFNKNNDELDGPITITRQFTVTVRGMANEYMETIRSALERFTLESLTYSAGLNKGETINSDSVTDNIQLLTSRKLGIDGGKNAYKIVYTAYIVGEGICPVTVNGYSANVLRPISEQGVEVILRLTITKQNAGVPDERYSDYKELRIRIAPLKPSEINAELALLELVKANFFAGLNDGANVDPSAIVSALHRFAEAYVDANGNLVWVYNVDNMANLGITLAELPGYDPMGSADWRLIRSSNASVITHENLLVYCPQTDDAEVTLYARLKSIRFGSYYEQYKDDPVYGPIFQRLAGEDVDITVTVVSLDNQAKAEAVRNQIAAIESVTRESREAIEDARAAYDALSENLKLLVSNYSDLVEAERLLQQLDCAAGDHLCTEWVTIAQATCADYGYEISRCERCGALCSRRTEKLPHNYIHDVTAPTCDTKGYTKHTCSGCGYSYIDTIVDALGHSFGEWILDREATCYEDGMQHRTCERCDEEELCIIPAGTNGCAAEHFQDVAHDRWYHEAVDYAVNHKLMIGYEDGMFRPNANTSRAELVQILYRLAGEPAIEQTETPFKDVPAGKWYTEVIAWAYENAYITGRDDGTFDPNGKITREELVTILYRFFGSTPVTEDYLKDFPDTEQVHTYAKDAMNWAVANGLLIGDEYGRLNPCNYTTRAEIAVILMRLANLNN